MAKLNLKITDTIPDTEFKVTVDFTKDVDYETVENVLNSYFEVEMLSADRSSSKDSNSISLITRNIEKINLMKSRSIRMWRRSSGLSEINNN